MIPDVTLTTACMDLTSYYQTARDITTTIESMRTLLAIPVYLVIFCDSKTYPHIQQIRSQYNLEDQTYYVVLSLKMLWAYKFIDQVKKNREVFHPTRDARTCAESHIVCCNKFDFVLQTIQMNPFNTSKFGWIDANIGPNANKVCWEYKPHMLPDILNNVCDKFRIQVLNVTDKKYILPENAREYYLHYRWVVSGCFFTTGKDIGVRILNRLKENFVQTTNLGCGHGEEMLYLPILDEFYDDIHRTYGDYHHTFNNFIKPVVGLQYIRDNIVNTYTRFQYWKEGYDCCKIMLDQFRGEHDGIWFGVMYNMYLCTYYYKPEELEIYLNKFKQHIMINPALKRELDSKKEFYLQQFARHSELMNDL